MNIEKNPLWSWLVYQAPNKKSDSTRKGKKQRDLT